MYFTQYCELVASAIKCIVLDYSSPLGMFAVLLVIPIWKYSKFTTPSLVFATVTNTVTNNLLLTTCSAFLCLYYMDFSCYMSTGILVCLLIHLLWKYWKFTKLYEEFPTYPLILYYIYCTIFRKLPPNLPITSSMFQIYIRLAQKFHDEGLFLVWAPNPALFIFSEEAVQIFSNERAALNKSSMYDLMKEVGMGDGLVTCNAETWRKNRKILNPVFQVEALKHTVSIFNDNAEKLVKKLEEKTGELPIEVLHDLKYCVGEVVCEYTLGIKIDNPDNKAVIEDTLHAIRVLSESFVYRLCHPWLHPKFVWNLVPVGRKARKMYEYCRNFTKKVILKTKESVNLSKSFENSDADDKNSNRNSFAYILLKHHLEDPDFTMEYIEEEVSTILAAGYDTISHALMWTLFLLGHHPDVQEKAFNEVHSISEGVIQYDDLHKLKYLECVIKETLRLYSPVPIFGRRIDKDVQCGKYKVPKGTDIVFFPYMLHRNPVLYPDPDKFNPDRFLDGKMENRPWAFTPFAEGIRNCIGKRFAMMEMKVLLAHIIRRFRIFSLDRREDIDISWEIILRPVKPPRMQLSLR